MVRRVNNSTAIEEDNTGVPSLAALSHEVKELVRLISTTDISELDLESGSVRIRIKRGGQGQVANSSQGNSSYTPPAIPTEMGSPKLMSLIGHNPAHGSEVTTEEGEQIMVAPMVGTFYSAPAPNADPYVKIGESVEAGQTIGIIEAMKMMNEIEAEVTGRITRILVENAQPVEYGQPLMLIQSA